MNVDLVKLTSMVFVVANAEWKCQPKNQFINTENLKDSSELFRITDQPILLGNQIAGNEGQNTFDLRLLNFEESQNAKVIAKQWDLSFKQQQQAIEQAKQAAQQAAEARAKTFCQTCIWSGIIQNKAGLVKMVAIPAAKTPTTFNYHVNANFRGYKTWGMIGSRRWKIAQLDRPIGVSLALDFAKQIAISTYDYPDEGYFGAYGASLSGRYIAMYEYYLGDVIGSIPSIFEWNLEQPRVPAVPKPCVGCTFKGKVVSTSFRGAKISADLTLFPSVPNSTKYLAKGNIAILSLPKDDSGQCEIKITEPYRFEKISTLTVYGNGEYFGFIRANAKGELSCWNIKQADWEDDVFFLWTLNRKNLFLNPKIQNKRMRSSILIDLLSGDAKVSWDLVQSP